MSEFDRDRRHQPPQGSRMHDLGRHRRAVDDSGGVPHSLGIMGEAQAAEAEGLTFLQISDSHVGFDKPANPNVLGTLEEAIAKVNALPQKPAFMIHTGDISHLSKAKRIRRRRPASSRSRELDVHYVPGEHDFLDPDQKLYRDRYGRGTKGAGWYSFDANGVHFIGLINVVDLESRRARQSRRRSARMARRRSRSAARRRRRSSCSPTFRCGRSIRTGAGAPTTARRRCPTSSASAR